MPSQSQPQATPQFDSPLVDPQVGTLSIPWQYFLTWVYNQLGGRTGASATGIFLASPPQHAGSVGSPGQIAFDQNFFYVCIGTNSWKRSALLGSF
jgi:hypothetical protein